MEDSRDMDAETWTSRPGGVPSRPRPASWRQPLALVLAAPLFVFAVTEDAQARRAPLPADETLVPTPRTVSEVVRRVQRSLTRLGLYVGPEDGRLTPATAGAVRIYQRSTGLKVDGRATKDLADHMLYTLGVRKLLRRLDVVRREGKSSARDRLLNHPATRDLVSGETEPAVADATRDPRPCFRTPTVRCLLDEARHSSRAVHKSELRDWALGEVLIAEARAGLGEQAMATASRITDPRLIMVALRDIAEAQAAGGRPAEALAAAAIIPDSDKNAEALIAIARIQVRRGDATDARATLAKLAGALDAMDDAVGRVRYMAQSAVLLAEAEDAPASKETLETAEAEARALDDRRRGLALRHVASALADMQETARALVILEDVGSASDKVPILMSAAEAQARAGDTAAALATAESITAIRYRAVVLGRIAVLQAAGGDAEAAATTLEVALAAVDRIKRPYARSYAISRIVLAMTRILGGTATPPPNATFSAAVAAAGRIEDTRLRAQTLWRIQARQIQAGDSAASTTATLAEEATAAITGELSRVWMFAELAVGHALEGSAGAGWNAFGQALTRAEGIGNAWARTRALAKLASTLIRLVDPGRGRSAEVR